MLNAAIRHRLRRMGRLERAINHRMFRGLKDVPDMYLRCLFAMVGGTYRVELYDCPLVAEFKLRHNSEHQVYLRLETRKRELTGDLNEYENDRWLRSQQHSLSGLSRFYDDDGEY